MASFAFARASAAASLPLHHVYLPPIPVPSTPPPVLLLYIHGLDSSHTTWLPFLDFADASVPYHRSFPSYLVDLRGHGESPLGEPSLFSPESVAGDLVDFLADVSTKPPFSPPSASTVPPKVVVCGHSMGGRVAMLLAAKLCSSPPLSLSFVLSRIIVEDMDVKERTPPFSVTWSSQPEAFDRSFLTLSSCIDELIKAGYEEKVREEREREKERELAANMSTSPSTSNVLNNHPARRSASRIGSSTSASGRRPTTRGGPM